MIKYVVLDFGKVLAGPTTGEWFLTPKFYELVDMSFISLPEIKNAIEECNPILSRKMVTQEEEYQAFLEFYELILKKVNYPKITDSLIQALAFDFAYEEEKYTFYDGVEEELKRLSQKFPLILLSDNWPSVLPILKKHHLDIYFQEIYISSIYQEKKEEGTFFRHPLEDFSILKGEALMVDDNEKLLEVASKEGYQVRLMDREKKVSTSKYPILHSLDDLLEKD